MLAGVSDDPARLNEGFTAETGASVPPDARAESYELVGRARAPRRDTGRDPARGTRGGWLEAARHPALHAGSRPRAASRATRRGSTPRRASSWPRGAGCRVRCSRSTRSSLSPPPPRSSSRGDAGPSCARGSSRRRSCAFGARHLRRRALDEAERRRGLRLAARLGAADARVPRARLRAQQARRLGLRRRALARLRRADRRRGRVPRPQRHADAAGSGCSPRPSGRRGRCSSA